jgi:hypothetical protein
VVLSVGYRYLPQADGGPATNRMEPVATVRFPLKGRLLLTDRNRADLDWKSGAFTWRYRNRFQVEKAITIHSYRFKPYASAEFFYQSQYGKWSDTAIYAVPFLSVNTWNLIRITSIRTTLAKVPISNSTSWA